MSTGHKSTYPGKRVLITYQDGTQGLDRFLEDRDDVLVFATRGRVPARLIRTVSDYKPRAGGRHLAGEAERRRCVVCGNTYQANEARKMVAVGPVFVCRGCARVIAEQVGRRP
jgi:hypothetical protein